MGSLSGHFRRIWHGGTAMWMPIVLIAVFCGIAMLAIGLSESSLNQLTRNTERLWGTLQIHNQDNQPIFENQSQRITNRVLTVLPEANVQPMLALAASSSTVGLEKSFTLAGVPLPLLQNEHSPIQAIRSGALYVSQLNDKLPLWLGEALAKRLGLHVGDTLPINIITKRQYRQLAAEVVGIVALGEASVDVNQAYTDIDLMQHKLGLHYLSHMLVIDANATDDAVLAQISYLLPSVELSPWWKKSAFYQPAKHVLIVAAASVVIISLLLVCMFWLNVCGQRQRQLRREHLIQQMLGVSRLDILQQQALEAGLQLGIASVLATFFYGFVHLLLDLLNLHVNGIPGYNGRYQLTVELDEQGWLLCIVLFTTAAVLICLSSAWHYSKGELCELNHPSGLPIR